MTTITELLDELELYSRIYGSVLEDTPEGMDEVTKWQIRKEEARTAVDAEIQRMNTRIAELERENAELKGLLEE